MVVYLALLHASHRSCISMHNFVMSHPVMWCVAVGTAKVQFKHMRLCLHISNCYIWLALQLCVLASTMQGMLPCTAKHCALWAKQ